jgi:hypothetical protein
VTRELGLQAFRTGRSRLRCDGPDFLLRGYGPEQQSLLKLVATLVDPAPAQLVGGEGDPGLSFAGAGGHA